MPTPFLILLVDDNPLLLDILVRAASHSFSEAAFLQVHSSSHAIQYINQLDDFGPKLVLLDLDLNSDQSGLTVLTFLKSHPQAHSLPVVVLTIDDSGNAVESAYAEMAASFTVKPDTFAGWKQYLALLRRYWFMTVTLPSVRFHQDDQYASP